MAQGTYALDKPTERVCAACGGDMTGRRRHARVCSQKCANAMRGKLPRLWTRTEPKQCTVIENGERCTNTATQRLQTDVWCSKHAARAARNGSPTAVKTVRRPHGEVQEALHRAATHESDDCLLLPGPNGGRLSVSYQSQPMTAARAVWMIRHGDPGDAHVLHTCHRGDDGCISIRHLYLGDHRQNMVDMVESDRSTHGERHGNRKLTEAQVREICRRARAGENQRIIAEEFGISRTHVSHLKAGRAWWRVTTLET